MSSLEEQMVAEMDPFLIKVAAKLAEDVRIRKDINTEMGKFVRKA
jgi:hypothetical protein